MIEIALHFTRKPQLINFPTEWSELTAAQVIAYCRYVYPYRNQVFEVIEGQLIVKEFRKPQYIEICRAMLYSLIDIKFKKFSEISQAALNNLIFEEKLLHFLFLEYNLWINPMPEIINPNFAYYGPVQGFAEISLSEFLDADEAYRSYLNATNDVTLSEVEMLDNFIAIIYREKSKDFNPKSPDTNGDCREPYNDLTVKYRLENISKLPLAKKLVPFIWFESCKNFITDKYEVIFRSTEQTESEADAIDPILQISRNALNYNKFKNLPVMLVFEDIKKQIQETEKLKKSIKPVG